jgi:hypothetical protein
LGPQTGKDNAVGKPAPSRVPGATDQGHAVD